MWAAQNVVLAAGTFRRIQMYVEDSGLTNLRCLGIAGVVLVATAFGIQVTKIARRRTSLWLVRRQLDAFAVALVLWTVLPIDTIVWSYNVARIQAGHDQPLLHLYEQSISAEALPELLPLLRHRDTVVRRGVASRLRVLRFGLAGSHPPRWTEREIARDRALARIDRRRLDRVLPRDEDARVTAHEALRNHAYRVNGQDPNVHHEWTF